MSSVLLVPLLLAALLPSFVLLVYIYKKDKADKEPFGLLALLFILGCVSCLPALIMEIVLGKFVPFSEYSVAHIFIDNYFVVALSEELCKFLMLFLVTRKNKNFNCLFDGVIYAVVVSLGFATLENVLYVVSPALTQNQPAIDGFQTAIGRAIISIPGHTFFGIMMGYFYTFWHLNSNLSVVEKKYAQMGLIDQIIPEKSKPGTYIAMALLVPIAMHGTFDFLLSLGSGIAFLVFVAMLIGFYIFCFKKVREMSNADNHEENLIAAMLNRKYPYLYTRINQAMQSQQMMYNPYTQAAYNPYSSQNNYSYQYQQPQVPQQQPVQFGANANTYATGGYTQNGYTQQ